MDDIKKEGMFRTASESMYRIVDKVIRLDFNEINGFSFPQNELFGLQIIHEDALFCFIIKFSSNNSNLICFGPGAHDRIKFSPPFFDRWSWHKYFNQSTIAYADPIFFLDEDIRLGWFTGGKKWYMDTLSLIIKELSQSQGIINENILFFGSSGGGFSSVALGTLLKNSKVLINNSQFFIMNYDSSVLEKLFDVLEVELNLGKEEILDKFGYRFNLLELFERESYVPCITYYLNIQSGSDVKDQATPFIDGLTKFKIFNGLNLCLYEEFKEVPHEPLPPKLTIDVINHFSEINLNNYSENTFSLRRFENINGLQNEFNLYKLKDKINVSDEMDVQTLLNQLNASNSELLILKQLLDQYVKYNTARIDIKYEGDESNYLELIYNSDDDAVIEFPTWLNNNGYGMLIMSESGKIYLKFKCVGDGEINIFFRGVDFKDNNGNRLPIFVKFTQIIINNHHLINKEQFISHDQYYKFTKKVKNNEVIAVNISWSPI